MSYLLVVLIYYLLLTYLLCFVVFIFLLRRKDLLVWLFYILTTSYRPISVTGRRGRNSMVVGFTTTYAGSIYNH
jgi:hypothetical protein